MNIVLVLLVTVVLVLDFATVNKDDKRAVFVYIGIVFLIIFVSLLDKLDALPVSPIEIFIEFMTPVIDLVDNLLK